MHHLDTMLAHILHRSIGQPTGYAISTILVRHRPNFPVQNGVNVRQVVENAKLTVNVFHQQQDLFEFGILTFGGVRLDRCARRLERSRQKDRKVVWSVHEKLLVSACIYRSSHQAIDGHTDNLTLRVYSFERTVFGYAFHCVLLQLMAIVHVQEFV
jgi:hypothetical protein